MDKKILSAVFTTIFIPNVLNAGFHEFTMHSRANCGGFNESISWQWNHPFWLATNSVHVKPGGSYSCNIWVSMELTSRSAAYHYAEGFLKDNWIV